MLASLSSSNRQHFWQKVAEALAKKTGGLDVGWDGRVAPSNSPTNRCLRRLRALLPLYEITRS